MTGFDFAKALSAPEVEAGPEFVRIKNLPRRPAPKADSKEAEELAEFLTDTFARPGCRQYLKPGPLRAVQALALREAWEAGGGFGMLSVGAGKTGVSLLLPEVWQSARPVIVTDGSLVDQMIADQAEMVKTWKMRPKHQVRVLSYQKLSNLKYREDVDEKGRVVRRALLDHLKPTDFIFDECQKLSASGTVTTQAIRNYMSDNACRAFFMTGSAFEATIKEHTHVLEMALGENSPLPRPAEIGEVTLWARALDARVNGARARPGVLLWFLTPEERKRYDWLDREGQELEALSIVRRAIARWIQDTPGVVAAPAPDVDAVLRVHPYVVDTKDPRIDELFKQINVEQVLPDGMPIPDQLQKARHKFNAGFGHWTHWDPEPGVEFRFAYSQWAAWVRHWCKYQPYGLDSEARFARAVQMGLVDDKYIAQDLPDAFSNLAGVSRLRFWLDQQERYRDEHPGLKEPPSVAVWVSDEVVGAVRAWLEQHVGLVWVASVPLGERLEEELGIPFYRQGGKDRRRRSILKHKPGSSAIASIRACGTGKNLQHIWHKGLWLTPPTEQALGRTHRPGQTNDTVENWIYFGCMQHMVSYLAMRDLKNQFSSDMTLIDKKLLVAGAEEMPTIEQLRELGGERWV